MKTNRAIARGMALVALLTATAQARDDSLDILVVGNYLIGQGGHPQLISHVAEAVGLSESAPVLIVESLYYHAPMVGVSPEYKWQLDNEAWLPYIRGKWGGAGMPAYRLDEFRGFVGSSPDVVIVMADLNGRMRHGVQGRGSEYIDHLAKVMKFYAQTCKENGARLVLWVHPGIQHAHFKSRRIPGQNDPVYDPITEEEYAKDMATIQENLKLLREAIPGIEAVDLPTIHARLRQRHPEINLRLPLGDDNNHQVWREYYLSACAITAQLGGWAPDVGSGLTTQDLNQRFGAGYLRSFAGASDDPRCLLTDKEVAAIHDAVWNSGEAQPNPADALATSEDVDKLAAALGHDDPRVRRAAAQRLTAVSDPRPATRAALERLAREDLITTVRAAAILALGAGPDGPGSVILREQVLVVGRDRTWQRNDRQLRLERLLAVLGTKAEPALASAVTSDAKEALEVIAQALHNGSVKPGALLRDALLPLLADRGFRGQAAGALSCWPSDPVVTDAFTKVMMDSASRDAQPAMFRYLLPLQEGAQRLAFLKSVAGANTTQSARGDAIAALVADGAVAEIRPLMAAATGRIPMEIASGLRVACAGHKDPAVRAVGVDIIAKHLSQEDKYCQMGMVNVLGQFGADAAPALAAIKAINPGEDKKLKDACDQAVAVIEKAVKAKDTK